MEGKKKGEGEKKKRRRKKALKRSIVRVSERFPPLGTRCIRFYTR